MSNDTVPEEVLDEKSIRLIIKAINDSRSQLREHLLERSFKTNNGRYQDRWNYLFNNIEQNFKDIRFKCYVVDRGPLWSFIALYDVNSKTVYIIFKRNTFLNINRNKELNHYAKMFNAINLRNIYPKEPIAIQESLFKDTVDLSNLRSYINQQLDDMIGEIQMEAKLCVNILFEENRDTVTSISGNIANYNLEIKKTYNWNKFISPTIEEISDTKSIIESNEDKLPPINLKIRKGKSNKDKKDDMVGEKDNKDKSDKNDKNK